MTKTKITMVILGLVSAFLLILGLTYVTKLVVKDIQLSRAERTIEKAKEEYAKCVEIVMPQAQKKANEARQTISELNGLTGSFIKTVEVGQQSSPTLSGQK